MESPKPKDPQKELEIALAELEERVDRLRTSYEQYFMGYEKIEPGVLRKDVDRRFTALRKQQIRNTALRFRFNVITQKFNTYSIYWTRVCRQIEDGTYKRHVVRAAKRFGDAAPNKDEPIRPIEVELGDFEADDMASILAEVDAATEAYARGGLDADTLPPGVPSKPPVVVRPAPLPLKRSPMTLSTSTTSFVMSGGRETIGGVGGVESAPRAVRHAPLPPGTRQPVLVRRRADDAPASRPDVPSPTSDRAAPPSSSRLDAPAPSSVERPAPSSARAPGAPPPSEGTPPSIRRIAAPASTGRIAAANATPRVAHPAPYRPAALPPNANRLPVAPTSAVTPRVAITSTARSARFHVPPDSTPEGPPSPPGQPKKKS